MPIASRSDLETAYYNKEYNGGKYVHISTSTTTVAKTGAGMLDMVNINTKGTVASTVTIYDNTTASGTIIAVIDSLNFNGTLHYDAPFLIGLTIVTTGTVAPDVTVTFN